MKKRQITGMCFSRVIPQLKIRALTRYQFFPFQAKSPERGFALKHILIEKS